MEAPYPSVPSIQKVYPKPEPESSAPIVVNDDAPSSSTSTDDKYYFANAAGAK